MKIKIKYHNENCKIKKLGDWIDLRASERIELEGPTVIKKQVYFHQALIPLGLSMQLPKYFEANIVPRSSTYSRYGLMQGNHMGVVDYTYCGPNDIWKMSAVAIRDTTIEVGDRICQFRIRPTQDAPIWVKLKWLFTSKIKFVEVNHLRGVDRGGFGSTNNKNN